MKHIILYENFNLLILEQQTLESGAIFLEKEVESSEIKPGELYASVLKDEEGKNITRITYLKKDKTIKSSMNMNEEGVTIKGADGTDKEGIKIYITHMDLAKKESGDSTRKMFSKVDAQSCMESIDSFLSNCGAYSDVKVGKELAAKTIKTLLELKDSGKAKSGSIVSYIGTFLSNQIKLKKNVIPVSTEQQKEINKYILDTIKS